MARTANGKDSSDGDNDNDDWNNCSNRIKEGQVQSNFMEGHWPWQHHTSQSWSISSVSWLHIFASQFTSNLSTMASHKPQEPTSWNATSVKHATRKIAFMFSQQSTLTLTCLRQEEELQVEPPMMGRCTTIKHLILLAYASRQHPSVSSNIVCRTRRVQSHPPDQQYQQLNVLFCVVWCYVAIPAAIYRSACPGARTWKCPAECFVSDFGRLPRSAPKSAFRVFFFTLLGLKDARSTQKALFGALRGFGECALVLVLRSRII